MASAQALSAQGLRLRVSSAFAASNSSVRYRQPVHQVLAHLFNHQTHHRGQAHHLMGLALGRDKAPVLDLLAYQRCAMSVS
jgi:uncharacterized damage-inducible protein DinB